MTTPAPELGSYNYAKSIDVYDACLDRGFLPELTGLLDAGTDETTDDETPGQD